MNQQTINRLYGNMIESWGEACSLVSRDNMILATGIYSHIEGIEVDEVLAAIIKTLDSPMKPYRAFCNSLPSGLCIYLLGSIGIKELYYLRHSTIPDSTLNIAKKIGVELLLLDLTNREVEV